LVDYFNAFIEFYLLQLLLTITFELLKKTTPKN
jgi:hypothetical protein